MKHGTPMTIRPIVPEDEPLLAEFHRSLSPRTVYMRYFHILPFGSRVAHKRLANICHTDQDRETVLVADHHDPETQQHKIIAVGRWNKIEGTKDAEVAVLVSDKYQNRGLGTHLLGRLIELARADKLRRLVAEILPENVAMQRAAEKLGFRLTRSPNDPTFIATLDL